MRVAAQHARHLHENGHEVFLLVRRPDLRSWRRHLLCRLGLRPGFPPLPEMRGHFEGLDVPVVHLNEDRPLRVADVPDADLIVSTWWTTAEWAATLPPAKGRHVHFVQDYEDFVPAFRSRVAAVYNQDTAKIVVAGWLRDRLRDRHARKSLIVSNGVDTDHFTAPARPRSQPPRVGFLYNGHPRKNVGLAVAALDLARRKIPDLRAITFGVRKRPDDLPAWIEYEQSPSQTRIPQIYASCDLWLFPSKSEGFGLPLLEAMASGTPVLATRAGAAPELVDGRNGWLSEADPATYAENILAFLRRSEADWQDASAAARKTAEAHSIDRSSQTFEAALLSLHRGQQQMSGASDQQASSRWAMADLSPRE